MSFIDRVRSWWGGDKLERAVEDADLPDAERDADQEDYQARKDETFVDEHFGLEGVDFERDSEPPKHP